MSAGSISSSTGVEEPFGRCPVRTTGAYPYLVSIEIPLPWRAVPSSAPTGSTDTRSANSYLSSPGYNTVNDSSFRSSTTTRICGCFRARPIPEGQNLHVLTAGV